MKPQHHREDFIFKEDVLARMLRSLRLIAQDSNKLQNMKSLHIKKRYGFEKNVCNDACYEDNEKNCDFALLDNSIISKENINWPFISTTNSPHTRTLIWVNHRNLMAILILCYEEEVVLHTSFDIGEQKHVVDYEKMSTTMLKLSMNSTRR